jgi:hypothetical protein
VCLSLNKHEFTSKFLRSLYGLAWNLQCVLFHNQGTVNLLYIHIDVLHIVATRKT